MWDDLYIFEGTQQGIYYQVTGTAPNRQVIFEYYTSAYVRPTEYYHFTITYNENVPGIATFQYYSVSLSGGSATVGGQSITGKHFFKINLMANHSENKFTQYSFNQPDINPGLTL